jgi:hypothetical protein
MLLLLVRGGGTAALEDVLGHGLGAGEVDLQRRQGNVDLMMARGSCFRMEVPLDAVVCKGDETGGDDNTGYSC